MTYLKPTVEVLGDASIMIESLQSKTASINDGSRPLPNSVPAYDLDE